ncbi:MAG TPA: carboxymuconolactone decarboxylase family protein [Methanomicrobiales archaeon]|jgi:pyruvate dehydrogenase E2 component (dihydrolipoamide acetyltransferase)|nr:carboxymuconolactone decarboxylase family protein [Methanomicrobiales archaeon]
MTRLSDTLAERDRNRERILREAPDLATAFSGMIASSLKPGALDRRQKELIGIAGSVITRCEPCLAHHVRDAIAAGASRQQVIEAASVGVNFGGAPSFVFVYSVLMQFLDDVERH